MYRTDADTNEPERAWRRHLEFEPEESRLLGLTAEGRRSLRRLEEQVELYRTLITAPEAEVSDGLRRLARLAVRRFDRGEEFGNLERILLPRMVGMEDAAGFVDEVVELLREGVRRKSPPPIELATHFAETEVPGIVAQVADEEEREAWQRLQAVLEDDVLPAARPLGPGRWRLGEEEYAWRIANMGIAAPLDELANAARECLREQHAAINALLGVDTFGDALPRLQSIGAERLREGEVESVYRDANARCVDFVRERKLFDLPEDFDVPLTLVPPEMASVTHAGNHPAPLFGEGGGSFAVLDVPERHRRAWVLPLAVHEGVPGHFLQSRIWQRTFRPRGAAPDFVSFADPIAAERQDWGAMPAIEGWAVYAEELMRAAGFHAKEQELAVRVFHTIRCARTCVDIGLHAQGMSRGAAERLLVESTGLDPVDASRELLRCMRIPTQPTTYFAGWRAIEALVSRSGLPRDVAHRHLLACGPVLPKKLA